MKAILNGQVVNQNHNWPLSNRGFLCADTVTEYFYVSQQTPVNLEEHYFNLCAAMRIFRLPIPSSFTQEYLQEKITLLLQENQLNNAFLEIYVSRSQTPNTNLNKQKSWYWLQACNPKPVQDNYKVDVYKDYTINTNLHDRVHKPDLMNGFATIFSAENDWDDLILQNKDKKVARSLHGSIFLIKDKLIKTPSSEQGALTDVARNKMIVSIDKSEQWEIQTTDFYPFELSQADELFVLNHHYQIQPITQMRKKSYPSTTVKAIQELFNSSL